MVGIAPRTPVFGERVDEWGDDDLSDESRESGMRRIARRLTPPEVATPRRDSQRPTVPVPGTPSLVGYLECPPRIQDTVVETGHGPRVAIQMRAVAPILELRPEPPPPAIQVEVRDERLTAVPPRGNYHDENPEPAFVSKAGTLRLRLTPYAREHAQADGDTDDTPGAMLDYLKVLGSVDRVPYVTASMKDILLAKLDHREGFVLSLVDGRSDIDALIDASPMPTHKTLRILLSLRAQSLIGVKEPTRR
jgi:hypothetical protein